MRLFIEYLHNEVALMNRQNIRLGFLGDRTGLPDPVRKALAEAQAATAANDKMLLNIAVNYGGRDEITRAVRKLATKVSNHELAPEDITEEMISKNLDTWELPDPDLLIRTSGEQRLSNYLPWQLAYTEFYFTDVHWPDFNKEELIRAFEKYNKRERRFGGVTEE